MAQTTLQFISQVKLGELRRQRARLLEAYDALDRAGGGEPVRELRARYDGLREITVAGKPMHPELANLEFLLAGGASAETVAFWLAKLKAEAGTGRLRADIVYLFGALLGEWGEDGDPAETREERTGVHGDLLRQAHAEAPVTNHGGVFDAVFAKLEEHRRESAVRMATVTEEFIEQSGRADTRLHTIADNIYVPAAVRDEAKRFAEDAVLRAEFDGAVGVAARDPREWDWPAEGVPTRALWTRNKWRLYPDLPLVPMCLAAMFGHFWADVLRETYGDTASRLNRLDRLHRLILLNAPSVIMENEKRMLRQEETERIDLGWYEPADPWDGVDPLPREDEGFAPGVASRRASEQSDLRRPGSESYLYGAGTNGLVRLVNAEVRTVRAAFPERPLFVVTFDIANFFASLSHAVLLDLLTRLGLPEIALAGIARFLAVPHRIDGQRVPATVGVPMNQHLSHVLAEYLLRLMERFIHQRARVRIVRQLDDVCLMAPDAGQIVTAWEAAREFLGACGLTPNMDKSGALAIGAELPVGLPVGRTHWGQLELTAAGEWGVHEETFRKFLADTQKHVAARSALLGRVTFYNAQLNFLTTALGLDLDLGDAHREAVGSALRRFEAEAFGPGVGVVAGLRAGIADRYLEGTGLGHLPESWMHWPITAGGVSLKSVLVLEGQYRQAMETRRPDRVKAPTDRPETWQHGNKEWDAFYADQLQAVTSAKPRESKVMRTLADDFIARGREISGGKQETLSDYWRWVLCLYGPEVLEKFGTFRFLLTDLVPLQLIHQRLLNDSSLEG